MEALILDRNFELIAVLDAFESFIWTERYRGYGDFEIYMKYDERFMPFLQKKNYVMLNESDTVMIIERIFMESSVKNGSHITISGRSLESIPAKRVIWDRTILTGNFQEGIKTLLDRNIISPETPQRKIPNFIFTFSSDLRITPIEIDTQFFGENLYDAISTLCEAENLGYRITLQNKKFVFELYLGVNRSYTQDTNPWVVFSPNFDNIENSSYETNVTNYANASLVIGEEDFSVEETDSSGNTHITDYPQMMIEVTIDDANGLDRQEIFTDASSTSRQDYEEDGGSYIIPDETYASQLANKGLEDLSEYSEITKIEGQVDATKQFVYGKDFKMGDIVQVVNEYGLETVSQVVEVIRSQDVNGYKITPTFVSLFDEEA